MPRITSQELSLMAEDLSVEPQCEGSWEMKDAAQAEQHTKLQKVALNSGMSQPQEFMLEFLFSNYRFSDLDTCYIITKIVLACRVTPPRPSCRAMMQI